MWRRMRPSGLVGCNVWHVRQWTSGTGGVDERTAACHCGLGDMNASGARRAREGRRRASNIRENTLSQLQVKSNVKTNKTSKPARRAHSPAECKTPKRGAKRAKVQPRPRHPHKGLRNGEPTKTERVFEAIRAGHTTREPLEAATGIVGQRLRSIVHMLRQQRRVSGTLAKGLRAKGSSRTAAPAASGAKAPRAAKRVKAKAVPSNEPRRGRAKKAVVA